MPVPAVSCRRGSGDRVIALDDVTSRWPPTASTYSSSTSSVTLRVARWRLPGAGSPRAAWPVPAATGRPLPRRRQTGGKPQLVLNLRDALRSARHAEGLILPLLHAHSLSAPTPRGRSDDVKPGLAGIAPESGWVLQPFLGVEESFVAGVLLELGFEGCDDPSDIALGAPEVA